MYCTRCGKEIRSDQKFCGNCGAKNVNYQEKNDLKEMIEKAVAGEAEAIDAVLRHYAGHIKYLSTYRGHINDDIQNRLKAQLIKAILQFRFDR